MMKEENLRMRIKEAAVEHFNRNGYHGTTIRSIAGDVGCSLPMIYYYYKNKKELFDEIVKRDYFQFLSKQELNLESGDIIGGYTKLIHSLNSLSSYDRHLYRLGVKVYLSFDGDAEHIQDMDTYEETVYVSHAARIKPHLVGSADCNLIAHTLMHLLDTLIMEIVVKGKTLPEEQIRGEISLILERYQKRSSMTEQAFMAT